MRERLTSIGFSKATTEDFWALNNISFNVEIGESIGIIGKNGAGKSTLLKVLSKITPPTKGKIISRGRLASLLEVGTGFHPELTGRENIFLNGSLLGMKQREIEAKFDEIVDFSGVEKFLDTPLKHYSSGMHLRLAFSVAAFLEPEILIVDEVLAVGDAEFQKKCLRKMENVSQSGRTILFVSHNMAAVENLCKNSILLQGGELVDAGLTSSVVSHYLRIAQNSGERDKDLASINNRKGNGKLKFTNIHIDTSDALLSTGKKLFFNLTINNIAEVPETPLYVAVTILNQYGEKMTTLDNYYTEQKLNVKHGEFNVTCEVNALWLVPGQYTLSLWCANYFETYDQVDEVFSFDLDASDVYGTGKIHNREMHGNFIVPNKWT